MNSTASLTSELERLSGGARHNTARHLRSYIVLADESPLHSDDDNESVLSIQAKETDFAQDTPDTESWSEDEQDMVEYELETEEEVTAVHPHIDVDTDSSGEIISTRLLAVAAVCEGDGEGGFADSEQSDAASDPELGPHDYWQCAQCLNTNNNPLYRYCEKCFKVRKNLFPPRPKRKARQSTKNKPISKLEDKQPSSLRTLTSTPSRSHHTDSGVDSAYNSQEFLSQESCSRPNPVPSLYTLCITICKAFSLQRSSLQSAVTATEENVFTVNSDCKDDRLINVGVKRRRDRENKRDDVSSKRRRMDSSSHSDSDASSDSRQVAVVTRAVSDPAVVLDTMKASTASQLRRGASDSEPERGISTRALMTSLRHKMATEESEFCIICCVEPKSGVFVHGRNAHICCCYKCAKKVWATVKTCPVCKCKVSNVLKAIVM